MRVKGLLRKHEKRAVGLAASNENEDKAQRYDVDGNFYHGDSTLIEKSQLRSCDNGLPTFCFRESRTIEPSYWATQQNPLMGRSTFQHARRKFVNILVTGGAGFIASHVVDAFL